MYVAYLAEPHDFENWRTVAREFALAGVPFADVEWRVGDGTSTPAPPLAGAATLPVPRAFVDLAQTAIRHDHPDRFRLLYALLLRVASNRDTLQDRSDPILMRVEQLAREVRMSELKGGNAEIAWASLRDDASHCTRCHLYRDATQTIFGEGPVDADLMLVGEQPGDQEDVQGRPFVGPAGKLLDRALNDAGIERDRTYVTNAVKHFKFVTRGKRRIHEKPDASEISACRWWLEQERALVAPKIIVALGATAAQSLLGKAVTISRTRGSPIDLEDGSICHVTVHPSYLLRIPDEASVKTEYGRFVEDLARANAAAQND